MRHGGALPSPGDQKWDTDDEGLAGRRSRCARLVPWARERRRERGRSAAAAAAEAGVCADGACSRRSAAGDVLVTRRALRGSFAWPACPPSCRSARWSTPRPGRVRLTSADPDPAAELPDRPFFRGVFRIETAPGQRRPGEPGDSRQREPVGVWVRRGRRAQRTASRRVLGLLRGTAKGRFRTTGRFAAATVRGTDWGVRDRCDGTLTVVRGAWSWCSTSGCTRPSSCARARPTSPRRAERGERADHDRDRR